MGNAYSFTFQLRTGAEHCSRVVALVEGTGHLRFRTDTTSCRTPPPSHCVDWDIFEFSKKDSNLRPSSYTPDALPLSYYRNGFAFEE